MLTYRTCRKKTITVVPSDWLHSHFPSRNAFSRGALCRSSRWLVDVVRHCLRKGLRACHVAQVPPWQSLLVARYTPRPQTPSQGNKQMFNCFTWDVTSTYITMAINFGAWHASSPECGYCATICWRQMYCVFILCCPICAWSRVII